MIIQRVLKGLSNLTDAEVQDIFTGGLTCNWWRTQGRLIQPLVPDRLTDRNLEWHRHSFTTPDPLQNYAPFCDNTPFISTTAGTVDRDTANQTNTLVPAWRPALYFATNRWTTDGWLFYCHLFLIGRRAVAMEAFSEELRDVNLYTGFSPVHLEGEITAKLVIPAAQIERADFYSLTDARAAAAHGALPTAQRSLINTDFVNPLDYSNLRELLA
jgi:hypothetical protein